MTILHEDELDNTRLATARRRKKKIPAWANRKRLQSSLSFISTPSMFFSEEQLEVAVINQIYFQKIEPEDIFGSICIDHARELLNAMMMDLWFSMVFYFSIKSEKSLWHGSHVSSDFHSNQSEGLSVMKHVQIVFTMIARERERKRAHERERTGLYRLA